MLTYDSRCNSHARSTTPAILRLLLNILFHDKTTKYFSALHTLKELQFFKDSDIFFNT